MRLLGRARFMFISARISWWSQSTFIVKKSGYSFAHQADRWFCGSTNEGISYPASKMAFLVGYLWSTMYSGGLGEWSASSLLLTPTHLFLLCAFQKAQPIGIPPKPANLRKKSKEHTRNKNFDLFQRLLTSLEHGWSIGYTTLWPLRPPV